MSNNICDSCGAELAYNFRVGELKCCKCGKIITFPTQKVETEKKDFTSNSSIKQNQSEKLTYKCENCGRTSVVKRNTDSLKCEHCGSGNLIRVSKLDYVPDGIIPFTLNQKEAKTCFLNWIKKKKFLPKNLKTKISKSLFEAKYMPIFSYDFDISTHYYGTGINYSYDANNNQITHVNTFDKTVCDGYTDYVESANPAINSSLLKTFSNYNFDDLCVFRTEFLYSLQALETTSDLQQNCEFVKGKIKYSIESKIRNSLNYDNIKSFNCQTTFTKTTYNYLYVPVWFHSFVYKNKTYSFFINGATGKVGGSVPRAISKILLTIFGFILGAAAIGLLIFLLCR